MAQDLSRAITASLFSGNPPSASLVSYVKTLEEQPGSPHPKARFLILAAPRDGTCKLHKAKQNPNGSFSIGKTWALEHLQRIEVGKRVVNGRPHPLEFILIINNKTYRYDTELPSSQQAQFLVTLVRCWRKYTASLGRPQSDLVLVGFSVDSQAGSAPSPSSSSGPPGPGPGPGPGPSSSSQRSGHHGPIPSSGAASNSSRSVPQVASRRPSEGSIPPASGAADPQSQRPSRPSHSSSHSAQSQPPSASSQTPFRRPTGSSTAGETRPPPSAGSAASESSRPRPENPPRQPSYASSETSTAPSRPQQRPPSPRRRPSASAVDPKTSAPAPSSSATAAPPSRAAPPSANNPSGTLSRFQLLQQAARERRPSGVAPHEGTASTASVPTLSGSKSSRKEGDLEDGSAAAVGMGIDLTGGKGAGRGEEKARKDSGGGGGGSGGPDALDNDTILANVEEMLEGFEWRGGDGAGGAGGGGWGTMMGSSASASGPGGRGGRSKADEMERRLVSELKALEAASIHAIMESDDRVVGVVKQVDDALAELDKMDLMIGLYKTQLNLINDDIAHIESQNRGLQVQTSNQRALLDEIDKLMSTIHIPDNDLTALTQESLESQQGIERLERAAVSLYKALLSTRDTDMAAASERVGEYHNKASQFAKRVFDFLTVMFKYQVDRIANPKNPADRAPKGALPRHDQMEDFLGRYCGLMLFVKETDQARYQQICSAYFAAMSDLHKQEIRTLMAHYRGQVRKATDEELEASFVPKESPTIRQQSLKRVGTLARVPLVETGRREKEQDGKLDGSELFSRALKEIVPHLSREQGFVADFLNITSVDSSITFADYMTLETFFRRGASTHLAQQAQQGKLRDIKTAMELIFGFLEGEFNSYIDEVLQKDPLQVVGIMSVLDGAASRGGPDQNEFVTRILLKQYQRLMASVEKSTKEQIRSIEHTKLTLRKRKGVVPFVRIFPLYVARVESQLEGSRGPNVRSVIDGQYERICSAILDCLQQMAKMDGEGQGAEAKDQLNYHVILIDNTHHIVSVFSKSNPIPTLAPFLRQASEMYEQNLAAYIRLVLRRPLSRAVDYFAGLEQLLRTTPPEEVALHSAYTKSALRKVTGELRVKDLRKAIDALYKRVDKHFGSDGAGPHAAEHVEVLKTVWKACEDETVRLVTAWKGLISKCYPDEKSGTIDVGPQEIHNLYVAVQSL